MAGCPDVDTLAAMVSGTLSQEVRADIANHAAACEPCHALIDGLVAERVRETTVGGDELVERCEALDLPPGTSIGRYLVEERLGAGGMGVVHAAVDTELQRRVALKLLRPDREGEAGSLGRERLLREARTLALLSHPNVVTVFDIGRHQGHLFVAMELVDGGSLSAWLRKPRATEAIIARLLEAGQGLAAAHAAGVVHRDVKPDNILVGLDGRARVTDFGLARLGEPAASVVDDAACSELPPTIEALTRTGRVMGTPVYMPPEQLLRGVTNPHTDQWSFCATFYEALAGVRPFAMDDLAARSIAIAEGRPAAPPHGRGVPAWLRPILLRGLRADPETRWPSIAALLLAVARRRQRRRYFAGSIAGVLGIAGVATGLLLVAPDAPPKAELPNTMSRSQKWTDLRPGCDCPYSACAAGCVSVCRARDYTLGAKLAGVNTDSHQDALLGASADGDTILYLTGAGCSIDRLMLARRHGTAFVPVDLTDQLDRSRVAIFEGCCTLSADGQRVVLATAARTGFVQARLVGDRVLPPDDGDLGALIPGPHWGTSLRHPVLGADGLSLYYRLDERGTEPGEVGPLDGTYVVERADPEAAFGPPRRLKGRARQYDYVTGVSSDGLSLFMSRDYETHVLVRTSTTQPFGDPAPALIPGRLPGWRAVPLGGCRRIVTTSTPGGCAGEDIAYLEAVDAPR